MGTKLQPAIEREYGKPLRDVLIELYNKHERLADVAAELAERLRLAKRPTPSTISVMMLREGIKLRKRALLTSGPLSSYGADRYGS